MVTRIASNVAAARWATHIASADLRLDTQKPAADVAAGADARILADDRAAVVQSRGRLDLLV